MEVAGVIASAVTLAALFKSCIEAFDTIQLHKTQDTDFKKLLLRLNVEKCRLYIWGRSMRLTSGAPASAIDNFPFPGVVADCLEQIFDIFNDSDRLREKYGCKVLPSESVMDPISLRSNYSIRTFSAAFGNFQVRSSQAREGKMQSKSDILQKTRWVVHDEKRFRDLVQEVKDLISGLQDITKDLASTNKLEGDIGERIMSIRDVSTLEMVADVCEEPHPYITHVALTTADSVSIAATERLNVEAWVSQIESDESDGLSVGHLDDLTVTDLKYLILRNQQERSRIPITPQEPLKEAQGMDIIQTLPSLGNWKETLVETRRDLEDLCRSSHELVISALDGSYRNPPSMTFFDSAMYAGDMPAQLLRARALSENDHFAQRIRAQGRKRIFTGSSGPQSTDGASPPNVGKRDFARLEVEMLLRQIHGSYLSIHLNPRPVHTLFRAYSNNWHILAQKHMDNIGAVCQEFLENLIAYVWPTRMREPLRRHFLDPQMKALMEKALKELDLLTQDTNLEYFHHEPEYEDRLEKWRANTTETGASFSKAGELLEKAKIYYELSAERFIRNIVTQVIERHLLQGMYGIFTSANFLAMTKETIKAIQNKEDATSFW
ncbi:hypothetical protein CONLIGDRAFT_672180 [Coniochaeta ligniaria NRRL 30616]|uniref:GED domain-containing protein n=1 Tax=Coniochaeta ligniaria NRRL 30616 TaxID=1408157 RepID=A0A1J7JBQ1_9PEZI|nr:hypothetical protein CONLIGDRAFT_672180 [Coniochaeta ligniaria NRRL 30616]